MIVSLAKGSLTKNSTPEVYFFFFFPIGRVVVNSYVLS